MSYSTLLTVGYYISTLPVSYRQRLRGFGGNSIEITANAVVHWILNAEMPSLFRFTKYSKDRESLDQAQVAWALYYSIAMDIPSYYNISMDQYFYDLFERYFRDNHLRLEKEIKRLGLLNSHFNKHFKNFCQNIDTLPLESPLPRTSALNLKDLKYNIFMGNSSFGAKPNALKNITQYYEIHIHQSSQNFDEMFEFLRSDIEPKLRKFSLFKSFLASQNLESSKSSLYFHEIDKLAKKLGHITEEFNNKFTSCYIKIKDKESSRRNSLIAMESRFSNDVFEIITMLNHFGRESQQLTLQELQQKYPLNPLWNLKVYQKFSGHLEGSHFFQQAHNWVKEKSYVTKYGELNPDYLTDYDLESGVISTNPGVFSYHFRLEDLLIRIAYFLQFGYDQIQVSHGEVPQSFVFPSNRFDLKEQVYSFHERIAFELTSLTYSPEASASWKRKWFDSYFLNLDWSASGFTDNKVIKNLLRAKVASHKWNSTNETQIEKITSCGAICLSKNRERMTLSSQNIVRDVQAYHRQLTLDDFNKDLLESIDAYTFFSFRNNSIKGPKGLFTTSRYIPTYNGLLDEPFTYLISRRLGGAPSFTRYSGDRIKSDKYREFELGDLILNFNEYQDSPDEVAKAITENVLIGRPDIWEHAKKLKDTLEHEDSMVMYTLPQKVRDNVSALVKYRANQELRMSVVFYELRKSYEDYPDTHPMHFNIRYPSSSDYPILSRWLTDLYFRDIGEFNSFTKDQFVPEELKDHPQFQR